MRTPGEEIAHSAGLCFSEGIVDLFDNFISIGFCEDMDKNTISIILSDSRFKKVEALITQNIHISQSGCGICGRETIQGFTDNIPRVKTRFYRAGTMFCTYFTDSEVVDFSSAKKADAEKFSRFFSGMLQRGVYIAPSQFEAGFLSLAHSEDDVEKTVNAAYQSFLEVK